MHQATLTPRHVARRPHVTKDTWRRALPPCASSSIEKGAHPCFFWMALGVHGARPVSFGSSGCAPVWPARCGDRSSSRPGTSRAPSPGERHVAARLVSLAIELGQGVALILASCGAGRAWRAPRVFWYVRRAPACPRPAEWCYRFGVGSPHRSVAHAHRSRRRDWCYRFGGVFRVPRHPPVDRGGRSPIIPRRRAGWALPAVPTRGPVEWTGGLFQWASSCHDTISATSPPWKHSLRDAERLPATCGAPRRSLGGSAHQPAAASAGAAGGGHFARDARARRGVCLVSVFRNPSHATVRLRSSDEVAETGLKGERRWDVGVPRNEEGEKDALDRTRRALRSAVRSRRW